MKKILSLSFLLFFIFNVYGQKNDTIKIVILHTNDMHANIDKMPYIATEIQKIKKQNPYVLVFSAGDMFTGNPIVDRYKEPGYPMIEFMNYLGYNVNALGNHEFDYGQENLNKRAEQADFPIICANIVTTDSSVLKPLKPMTSFTIADSITIGVLGLIQVDADSLPASHPIKLGGLKFLDPLTVANSYKNYRDSFNIFICLSHLGIENDELLAKKVPVFDAIVGGHTHTLIKNGEKVKNTFIVQAGSRNSYIGVMTIKYINGKVVSISDSMIVVKQLKNADPELMKKLAVYNDNPELNKIIGFAKNALSNENELGALITDAMIDTLHVDFAFENIGGIRLPEISQGDITAKTILELQPFSNTLVTIELTKKQIIDMITYAYNLQHINEIEISGGTFELYVDSKNKLQKVIVYDKNGQELQNNKKYKVTTNDYMSTAFQLDFMKNAYNTYIFDADATINYVIKHSPIDYEGINRVKVIKSN